MSNNEWAYQFDPLTPNGKVEITLNGAPIFTTQTIRNAQQLCRILNSYSDMYEHAKGVMQLLETHGAAIVPHLLDTDDNEGEFLRQALIRIEGGKHE